MFNKHGFKAGDKVRFVVPDMRIDMETEVILIHENCYIVDRNDHFAAYEGELFPLREHNVLKILTKIDENT